MTSIFFYDHHQLITPLPPIDSPQFPPLGDVAVVIGKGGGKGVPPRAVGHEEDKACLIRLHRRAQAGQTGVGNGCRGRPEIT